MARTKNAGNGKLEEALATLIQNQAAFVALMSEADQRFARIEALLAEHSRTLADHGRILADLVHMMQGLPDAVRERMASGSRRSRKPSSEPAAKIASCQSIPSVLVPWQPSPT